MTNFEVKAIGRVESPLTDLESPPRQAIDGRRLRVRTLEALDGTPILDVKPILSGDVSLR